MIMVSQSPAVIMPCPTTLNQHNNNMHSIRYLLFKIQFFDITGLARTSQDYHRRFLIADKNYNFCVNFTKMLFNILKIIPIFGNFVIQYRFSMLFDVGLRSYSN